MGRGTVWANDAGEREFFYEDEFANARARGFRPVGDIVTQDVVGETTVYRDPEQGLEAAERPFENIVEPTTHEEKFLERRAEEDFGGATGALQAGALGVGRGLTLGALDPVLGTLGANMENIAALRKAHPGTSLFGEVGGALLPAILTGGATAEVSGAELAAGVARTAATAREAASLARVAGTIKRDVGVATKALRMMPSAKVAQLSGRIAQESRILAGGVEGAIYSAAEGGTELYLGDDPVTAERATSVLSSRALFGFGAGSLVGALGTAADKALARARSRMLQRAESQAPGREGVTTIADDLADLRVASEEADLQAITHKASPSGGELPKWEIDKRRAMIKKEFKQTHEAAEANFKTVQDRIDREIRESQRAVVDATEANKAAIDAAARAKKDVQGIEARIKDAKKRKATASTMRGLERERALAERRLEEAQIAKIDATKKLADAQTEKSRLALSSAEELKAAKRVQADEYRRASETRQFAKDKLKIENEGPGPWAKMDQARELQDVNVAIGKVRDEMIAKLRNRAGIIENPRRIKDLLQTQEQQLVALEQRAEIIGSRLGVEGDTRGMKAMEALPGLLEKNRALQARIDLQLSAAKPSLGQDMVTQMTQNVAFTTGLGAATAIGAPMPLALVGAGALGRWAGKLASGRLAKAGEEAATRMAGAVDRLLGVTAAAAPRAPMVASKVLSAVAFGPTEEKKRRYRGSSSERLVAAYRDREREIRAQTRSVNGALKMTAEARMELGRTLMPIAAVSPRLAYLMEQNAAERIEYLASKLGKRPDLPGASVMQEYWRPSKMEIRSFARAVAAVEDPVSVLERAAAGAITPEDGEALQRVYPNLLSEVQQRIVETLPALRKKLDYKQRLSLSILTGVPVDPALDPRILKRLQDMFAAEPGGGFEAPKAQPQFGSVRRPDATPAQEHAG